MRRAQVWTLVTLGAMFSLGALVQTGRLMAAPAVSAAAFQGNEPEAPKLRDATEAERKQVTTSIEAQLKAFRSDDYKAAEKYQHSSLKENFASTDAFRAMMRRGYPQVANYKTVTFGEAKSDEKGEQIQIRVTILGKDNVTVKMVYVMVKEEGTFRVLSVFGGQAPKSEPRDLA
jgi:hypothetical protein